MLFKNTRTFIFGFTLGFGTGYFAKELYPYVKDTARPAVKGLIKATIRGFEKMREELFRFGEVLEDLTAEVKVELKEEAKKKPRRMAKRPSRKLVPGAESVPAVRATKAREVAAAEELAQRGLA